MATLINTYLKGAMTGCLLVFSVNNLSAQNVQNIYPEVGKPMPDFKLDEVHYYAKKKVTLEDFKGKWLFLDCWGAHCGSCIEALPRTDSLQRLFAKDVKFLLVGYTGSQYVKKTDNSLIRQIYERNRKEEHLSLSIAYDSLLFHHFDIWTTPYIIIVDPSGIVRGITYHVNKDNIMDLLNGRQTNMPVVYRNTVRKKMNREKYGKANGS